MSNMSSREIEMFPFNRKNAERIKELGFKAVKAQAEMIAFLKSIGSGDSKERLHEHFEVNVVDSEMTLDAFLEKTFPELVPETWGFSK